MRIDAKGRGIISLGDVSSCALAQGATALASLTLTNAATNYAFAANIPAGTRYVELYCAAACQVSLGEATSTSVGRMIPAGLPVILRLDDDDVAAGKKLNARSATAAAVLHATYLPG